MGMQDGFRTYLEEQGKSKNTIQSYCRSVEQLKVQQSYASPIHTTLLYTNPTREKMKEKANLL